MLQEEEEERRVRRDDYKERPTVDKDNSRLLVQTLNGLVRGTTKSALGETVDVFLGVRNINSFSYSKIFSFPFAAYWCTYV